MRYSFNFFRGIELSRIQLYRETSLIALLFLGLIGTRLEFAELWLFGEISQILLIGIIFVTLLDLVFFESFPLPIFCVISFLVWVIFVDVITFRTVSYGTCRIVIPILFLTSLFHLLTKINYEKSKNCLTVVLIISVLLEMTFVLIQLLKWIPNGNPDYQIGGLSGHPGYTANLICLSTTFLILLDVPLTRSKWRYFLFFLIFLAAFYFRSRSSMMICFLVFFQLISLEYLPIISTFKKRIIFFFLLISMGSIIFLKFDSTIGRIYIWKNCFKIVRETFLVGTGGGSFEYVYNSFQTFLLENSGDEREKLLADHIQVSYNDIFQVAIEYGIVGAFLYIAFLIILFFCFFQLHGDVSRNIRTIFLCFLVVMCTWSILYLPSFSFLFYTFVAFCIKRVYDERERNILENI